MNIIILINLLLILFINNNKINASTSKKYNRFLAHIFNKYGNGITMSFEGLEHLMHNLGIGGLEFNPTHTIEEHHPNGYKIPDLILNSSEEDDLKTEIRDNIDYKLNKVFDNIPINEFTNTDNDIKTKFKELHDPKHRHPRDHGKHEIPNYCLSPQDTLKLVIDYNNLNNYEISKIQRREIISTTTPLIKNRDDTIYKKYNDHNREDEFNKFLNIVKISPEIFMKLCPALLVQMDQNSCIDIHDDIKIKSEFNQNPNCLYYAWIYASISIFILSACGLIGAALVPLMKSVAYNEILRFLVAVAVGTLGGDALMHLLPHALIQEHDDHPTIGKSEHNHSEPVIICSCTFLTICFMYFLENLLPLLTGRSDSGHGHSHGAPIISIDEQKNETINQSESKEINTMMNENKNDLKTGNSSKPMTPVAFMVVIGDGLHNLTDGLAIGASFAADPVTGMATAFAVLCHELPHELGDFALLLQTGVSIRRAIYLNIVSSVLSFIGMAIGLLIVDLHTDMVKWIYACTAGSFLYIALATLVPEMGRNGGKDIKNIIIQISGILFGGLIMLWIGLYEDRLKKLFQF